MLETAIIDDLLARHDIKLDPKPKYARRQLNIIMKIKQFGYRDLREKDISPRLQ